MVQITAPTMVPAGRKTPIGPALQQAIEKIVDNVHPDKIILFGSYAYGNPTPDSDVDLLIIWKTTLPLRERSWAVSQLLLPRQFPVDILVKTPQEISQSLRDKEFFIQEIISRGITLYERNR